MKTYISIDMEGVAGVAHLRQVMRGSDDFPEQARRQAVRELTAAAAASALTVQVADRFPLQEIAKAHDRVDAGGRGRVLITIPR